MSSSDFSTCFAAVSLGDRFRSNGGKWQVQWRAIWVTDAADHSAMIWASVAQWVRVSSCEEPDSESSQSPNQRRRSRPRLQSPVANLHRLNNAAGTRTQTAHDLWDDCAYHQSFPVCTSDFLGCTNMCRWYLKPSTPLIDRTPLMPLLREVRRGIGADH